MVLGREWLVALAAALSYGWIRLWFAAPAPVANIPLWILLPHGTRGRTVSAAASAAGGWRGGQVTILAVPEDAPRIGGEHLRAAGLTGEMEALFPLRAVHLDDWADAQPDAWPALPVRELYAPAELWPFVIGSRMESPAPALVIRGPDLPLRRRLLLGGFGPIFASAPLSTALVPRSAAPAVRPGITAAQFTSLPGTHFGARMPRSSLDFRRLLRPPVRVSSVGSS